MGSGYTMKKNILITGPFLSMSGYGYQARFALEAMRSREDLFNIFINNVGWGHTSWITDDKDLNDYIQSRVQAAANFQSQGGSFDLQIHVGIPNEMKKYANFNIIYTAAIETDRASGLWLQHCNQSDRVIVVSEHSKFSLTNASYEMLNEQQEVLGNLKIEVPVDVVNYCHKKTKAKKIDLDLKYDFNYLAVAQWSPRKNMLSLIGWFLEEMQDKEVGLVIKTSIANCSLTDRRETSRRLKEILSNFPNRKCEVVLVHGSMSDSEMQGLYQHDKIKCMVSTTHGEGFGLPLFEAAYNGLPVIATDWSGHLDFLYKGAEPLFLPIDYNMHKVQPNAVWKDIIEPTAIWAYVKENSYKECLNEMLNNYDTYTEKAKKLEEYILQNFTPSSQYTKFVDSVESVYKLIEDDIDEWLDKLVEVK